MRPNGQPKHIIVFGFSTDEWEDILSEIELQVLKSRRSNIVVIRNQIITNPEFLTKVLKNTTSEVYLVVDDLKSFNIPEETLKSDRIHVIAYTSVVDENTKTLLQEGAEVVVMPSVTKIPEELRGKVTNKLTAKFGELQTPFAVY